MQPRERVLFFDFAENYSFLVQDAAQRFHWNNSQATIHPLKVCHKSYACISNHVAHDTVTVN